MEMFEKTPETVAKSLAEIPRAELNKKIVDLMHLISTDLNAARAELLADPPLAYGLLHALASKKMLNPQLIKDMLAKPLPIVEPVPGLQSALQSSTRTQIPGFSEATSDIDLRPTDPRLRRVAVDRDMRASPPIQQQQPIAPVEQPKPQQQQQPDKPAPVYPTDPRQRVGDPRLQRPTDPRMAAIANKLAQPQQPQQQQQLQQQQQQQPPPQQGHSNAAIAVSSLGAAASDQDKAALIMQVLQLSDEQISNLPPEQRASIMVLKEQIAKTTHLP